MCLEREPCPLSISVEGLGPQMDSTGIDFSRLLQGFHVKATLIYAALLQKDIATKLRLSMQQGMHVHIQLNHPAWHLQSPFRSHPFSLLCQADHPLLL